VTSSGLALRRFRFEIPLLAAAIVCIGVAFIHSASFDPKLALHKPYAETQLRWLGIALAGFAAAIIVPYKTLERWVWPLYGIVLALLIGVHVKGQLVNGARSWYSFGPIKFQPSELAKIAIVLAVAKTLVRRRDMRTLMPFLAVGAVAGPAILSILKEPDLGSVLVFCPAIAAMLVVAGASLRWFAAFAGAGAAGFLVAYHFVFGEYQRHRIDVFLDPELDRSGAGYHTMMARIAVGSGGVWGQGLGEGAQTQSKALPEAHTDFVFSVISEEGGLVTAGLLLLLLLALLLVCLDVAWRSRDPFGRLTATGIATIFAGQVFVNAGMNIGVMPVTGITLPFVSYGGSSLLMSFTALGIVANIAMRPQATFADDFEDG